jgi:hypothetical protein
MRKYQISIIAILVCLSVFLISGCLLYLDTDRVYYLPYQEGFSSYVAQGNQGLISHYELEKFAIDFIMPVNTPISAARCGRVVEVVLSNRNINCPSKTLCPNNYITIEHIDGTRAKYVHLNRDMNPRVQVDEYVERGQFIAYSGNSGNSMVPHLHFEAWAPDENGDFNQALRVHFVDVEGDGVPRAYNTYTSQNHLGNGNCYGDSGLVSE